MPGIRSRAAVVFALSFAVSAWCAGPAAAEAVDLQLVLAADVSRSVDEHEFQLQRKGYAEAFRDPRVLGAIRSGPKGRIAVCFVEWSGVDSHAVIADWTVIEDEESAAGFAELLLAKPRAFANRTAIGAAIDFAVTQLYRSGHESRRRTIDVSGDGTNTNGTEPSVARAAAAALGITVNGLVIFSPEPSMWNPFHTHPPGGLDEYYRQHVIGGPEAFLMTVDGFKTFANAIVHKLIREIAAADGGLARVPDEF
jgi:hypothetical protein